MPTFQSRWVMTGLIFLFTALTCTVSLLTWQERKTRPAAIESASLCAVWKSQDTFAEREIHTKGSILFLEHGWVLFDPTCENGTFIPIFRKNDTPGLQAVEEIWKSHIRDSEYEVHVRIDGKLRSSCPDRR